MPQELSTIVYPSEDELFEALELGEISFLQYLMLREIAVHGIDSGSRHLLDEIPNLSYFQTAANSFVLPLDQEQEAAFLGSGADVERPDRMVRGHLGYRFIQRLEKDERSWYRSAADVQIGKHFQFRLRVNRESSGVERVVSRSMVYSSPNGFIRRVTLGNFTTRFGLGTLFGYQGKLLDFSEKIDGESFLFPDYGGYNGLYVHGRSSALELQTLASITRDKSRRLWSIGAFGRMRRGNFRPGIMIGLNRLESRLDDDSFSQPMYGLSVEYRYDKGYNIIEASNRQGDNPGARAAVVEGRHHFGLAEIRYAGWSYSDDFIDLTGGSKAADLRRSLIIEPLDMSYSSKRSGQDGLLMKTIVRLTGGLKLSNSLLYAETNGSRATRQFSSGLVRQINRRLQLQLDYLGRWHRRLSSGRSAEETDSRFRLESRFESGKLYLRSYIAYNIETGKPSSVSLFANVRYDLPKDGTLQVWSNLDRFDSVGVEYWYLYLRASQPLGNSLDAAIKLIHTYHRDAADPGTAIVSFELDVTV